MKMISRFDPPQTHPVEQSDVQYSQVHVPLAREQYMREPSRLAYHTSKVERQYDLAGGWNHRLTAWRIVRSWAEVEAPTEDGKDPTALSPEMLAAVKRDIPHCIRNLRRCPVEEVVRVDRRSGQLSTAEYIFEYDREPSMSVDEARGIVKGIADRIAEAAKDAIGLRLFTMNWVQAESEAGPIVEEGQLFTGRFRPQTDKVAYFEFAFDCEHWGEEFFAQDGLPGLLMDNRFAVSAGYAVSTVIAFDRR